MHQWVTTYWTAQRADTVDVQRSCDVKACRDAGSASLGLAIRIAMAMAIFRVSLWPLVISQLYLIGLNGTCDFQKSQFADGLSCISPRSNHIIYQYVFCPSALYWRTVLCVCLCIYKSFDYIVMQCGVTKMTFQLNEIEQTATTTTKPHKNNVGIVRDL